MDKKEVKESKNNNDDIIIKTKYFFKGLVLFILFSKLIFIDKIKKNIKIIGKNIVLIDRKLVNGIIINKPIRLAKSQNSDFFKIFMVILISGLNKKNNKIIEKKKIIASLILPKKK